MACPYCGAPIKAGKPYGQQCEDCYVESLLPPNYRTAPRYRLNQIEE